MLVALTSPDIPLPESFSSLTRMTVIIRLGWSTSPVVKVEEGLDPSRCLAIRASSSSSSLAETEELALVSSQELEVRSGMAPCGFTSCPAFLSIEDATAAA